MLGLWALAILTYVFNTTDYDLNVMYFIISWVIGIYYLIFSDSI